MDSKARSKQLDLIKKQTHTVGSKLQRKQMSLLKAIGEACSG